jgi:hypothetical protein
MWSLSLLGLPRREAVCNAFSFRLLISGKLLKKKGKGQRMREPNLVLDSFSEGSFNLGEIV